MTTMTTDLPVIRDPDKFGELQLARVLYEIHHSCHADEVYGEV